MISKTLDGIITSWNRSAERIFGYTAEEAIGQHITLIVPLIDERRKSRHSLGRLRRGERVDHFRTVREAEERHPLHVSLTISPLRD